MSSIADSSGGRAHGLSVQNRTDLPDTLIYEGKREVRAGREPFGHISRLSRSRGAESPWRAVAKRRRRRSALTRLLRRLFRGSGFQGFPFKGRFLVLLFLWFRSGDLSIVVAALPTCSLLLVLLSVGVSRIFEELRGNVSRMFEKAALGCVPYVRGKLLRITANCGKLRGGRITGSPRRAFRRLRYPPIKDRRRLKGRQKRTLVREWHFDGYSTSRGCSTGGIAGAEGKRIKTPGAVA